MYIQKGYIQQFEMQQPHTSVTEVTLIRIRGVNWGWCVETYKLPAVNIFQNNLLLMMLY